MLSSMTVCCQVRAATSRGGVSVISRDRVHAAAALVSSGVHTVHRYSILRAFLCMGLALAWAACNSSPANPKVPRDAKSSGGLHATIETDKGPIELEFLPDAAPRAVENFRLLAEHGYYDGL